MGAQDESLRLVAEVVDKFSAPLRNLRTMLQGVQNPAAVEKMKAGFEGAQKAATGLSREVSNTLTPALNAAGIAGLSISGALLGVGAALRAFTGSTAGLALIGRETGMLVQNMRVLEEVGKRFDIAPEAMQQSFRNFAENAQQLRKGIGDVTGFLASQSPAVAKWAADLRRDLNNGLNPDEAYKRALEFMRRIEDPIDRSKFAEKLFGSKQFGVLGSEDLGRIFADVERQIGKLPKGAAESALAFKRAWDDVSSSLIGLRDTIGISVLPVFKDLLDTTSKWLSDPAIKNGLATAFNDLQEALRKFDWKQFRAEMSDFFGAILSEGKGAIETVKLFAQVFNALGEGRVLDAIKLLDSKPVLPPGALGKPRSGAETQAQALEGRRDQIQRLLTVFDANPANRRDPDGSAQRDRLVRELESLTREIEQLRRQGEEAKVQQQSFTGGGVGGGLIQNAAFGAMVASGGAARGLSSPWGGGGRFPALRGGGSPGMRRTREAMTGSGGDDAPFRADGTIAGLSREETQRYASILGHRESGNRYGIRNSYGYSGRWQMGAAALAGTGYVKPGTKNGGLGNDSAWTGKDGINSLSAFLGNQGGVQDRQFLEYTDRNRKSLERLGVIKPGMSASEIAGWLAAAHLKGPGGAAALARGRDNADANGTSASSYFRMMARIGDRARSVAGISAPPSGGLRAGDADALMRKALRSPMMGGGSSVDVKGGANLDITLRGFPPGTSTNGATDGIEGYERPPATRDPSRRRRHLAPAVHLAPKRIHDLGVVSPCANSHDRIAPLPAIETGADTCSRAGNRLGPLATIIVRAADVLALNIHYRFPAKRRQGGAGVSVSRVLREGRELLGGAGGGHQRG